MIPRTGQLLNLAALAAGSGISHNTASAWISVLEASCLIHLLRPHHRNFNKRLVKMPKLYFCDAGLAAWLAGIRRMEDMVFHPVRGAVFETLVVGEFLKRCWNEGMPSNLFFRRDSKGLEIDLLLEKGEALTPVEIKSGATIASDYLDNLKKWVMIAGGAGQRSWLIYGGEQRIVHGMTQIVPLRFLDTMPM